MRKHRGKLALIVIAVVVSLVYLYPTYRDHAVNKELSNLHGADSLQFIEQNETTMRSYRAERIKLGLDLQGGMRVVLEVNVLKLLEDLAKNKDDAYNQIIQDVREEVKHSEEDPVLLLRRKFEERQIRMSRYYGALRDDNDKIFSFLEDESKKAIDRAMEIVRNRVDQYGVSEPSIQKLGGTRVIVELPGVSNEGEVRQLLQGTALLEFKLLKAPEMAYKVMEGIDKQLASAGVTDSGETAAAAGVKAAVTASPADSGSVDTGKTATPEGELSKEEFAVKHPFFAVAQVSQQFPGEALVAEDNKDKVRRMLERPDVRHLIPDDMEFVWSAKSRLLKDASGATKPFFTLYPVSKTAELTGGVVINAHATLDPSTNLPIVTMEMNSEGSHDWARITGANINKRIAIVLDNAIFSAPVVRNKITGGHSQIEGMDNIEEARLLEIVLKAGALPAPVEIVEQRTVGPSLGEDSIRKGIMSALLATGLTVLFMLVYYRSGGFVADLALVFCLLFLMGVLAAFRATLTLPGLAGIILTLAVAVDANVLIYERIREELVTGKTLRAAIETGYEKAFSAIFDSNLTTFITGLILYQFGTGPVQGFALTLMIGIVASMFSAIFITHVFFNLLTEKSGSVISFG